MEKLQLRERNEFGDILQFEEMSHAEGTTYEGALVVSLLLANGTTVKEEFILFKPEIAKLKGWLNEISS
jgi:hypothetical protein